MSAPFEVAHDNGCIRFAWWLGVDRDPPGRAGPVRPPHPWHGSLGSGITEFKRGLKDGDGGKGAGDGKDTPAQKN
jgi:hypothetical protein